MWKYFLHKIKQKLPTDKVTKIRLSLATIYAFSAWNLVIIIFYQSIKKDIPTTAESKEKFVKKMKETNVDVEFIEFKGIGINTSKSEKNETNVVST